MKTRHKRIMIAVGALAVLGTATALVLNAFNSNLVFFYSPTQVAAKEAPTGRTFRLGGMVVGQDVPVQYQGILPDLFKEGKGVVAQGQLKDGHFEAREVLAKHDENYMPPEAAEALRQAGKNTNAMSQTVLMEPKP